MTPVQIARIAHEAVRAYDSTQGNTQLLDWENISQFDRDWYVQGIGGIQLGNITTPALLADTYTTTPFTALSAEEQMRVLITFEVARACSTTVTGSSPRDEELMDPALDSVGGYPNILAVDWAGEDIDGAQTFKPEGNLTPDELSALMYGEPPDPTGGPNNDD